MRRDFASFLRPSEEILRHYVPQTCPERSRRNDLFLKCQQNLAIEQDKFMTKKRIWPKEENELDIVNEAGRESFPASDPPTWTLGREAAEETRFGEGLAMPDLSVSDSELRAILEQSQVIAIVGESNDHYYTSYQVAHYLKEMGYTVYPVNPNIADVDGDPSYPSLRDVPEAIDIVDVFRTPEFLDEVVEAAIAVGAQTLWAQLGVVSVDERPERKALKAGMKVVSNMCIRTEHERLGLGPKRKKE